MILNIFISVDNDIAIITLKQDIRFDSTKYPACIATSEPSAGSKVTVSGWGATSYNGGGSQVLKKIDTTIVSRNECSRRYSLTANMICAAEPGKDSCQGDSGGPLVQNVGGRKTFAGVVSFGHKCAEPNYPGVYTNVAKYNSWIKSRCPC